MEEIVEAVVLLLIGFVFLVKGADFFVDGSSSVAKKLHIPPLVIGMTIVAMGTSLPELSVSVRASLIHQNSLAISNVVGSNIFNLMVVLGASAIISPLIVSRTVIRRDYPISILCTVLLLITGLIGMKLNRPDGLILLVVFVIFLYIEVKDAIHSIRNHTEETPYDKIMDIEVTEKTEEIKDMSLGKGILFILIGAVGVKLGGDWVVDGAVRIAESFGVTETLIGLTIVACGTSLPELATSVIAAKKGEQEMAIGNVVGSNIFNILFILGIAATITPVAVINENILDILVLLVFSLLVWILCWSKRKISRLEGAGMVGLYLIYLVYICIR